MDKSKRQFINSVAALSVGTTFIPLSSLSQAGINDQPPRRNGQLGKRWAMVVDLRKCIGCQSCTIACTIENQLPIGQFRTHVDQYEVQDSENPANITSLMLPRLCNHCDEPACVPVCPVQATYQQKDGIVVIDNERCVGCGYCVQACPYDARFINKETNTADKCTFCTHRLEVGLLPACVESCVGGARIIGDLNQADSQISHLLKEHKEDIKVLKPQAGTKPHVYYIGLTNAFKNRVTGQSAIWQPTQEITK